MAHPTKIAAIFTRPIISWKSLNFGIEKDLKRDRLGNSFFYYWIKCMLLDKASECMGTCVTLAWYIVARTVLHQRWIKCCWGGQQSVTTTQELFYCTTEKGPRRHLWVLEAQKESVFKMKVPPKWASVWHFSVTKCDKSHFFWFSVTIWLLFVFFIWWATFLLFCNNKISQKNNRWRNFSNSISISFLVRKRFLE